MTKMKSVLSILVVFVSVLPLLLEATAFNPSIDCSILVTADNTFEIYHNRTELKPPDNPQLLDVIKRIESNLSKYHSKYCLFNEPNLDQINPESRCIFDRGGETHNITAKEGDVVSLKYYNGVSTTNGSYNYTYLLDIFQICDDAIKELFNPAAFIVEVTTNDTRVSSTSIRWLCTPGNVVEFSIDLKDGIDMTSDEYKLFADQHPEPLWQPPELAALNQVYNWVNNTKANPERSNIRCTNGDGRIPWYKTTNNGHFSERAEWLFNIFPSTTYAYCHGVISIVFRSSVITEAAVNGSFSFNGPLLVLSGDIALDSSGDIQLQPTQAVNFTDCVTLAGKLTVYVNSTAQTNNTITPLYYSCRNGGSEFSEVAVVNVAETREGCELAHEDEYGSRGLSVLIYERCGGGDGEGDGGADRKVIVGVVVGVGGCILLVIVVGLILTIVGVVIKQNGTSV